MQNTLPPEWGKQCAVMLTWPHIDTDWAGQLEEVEAVFIEICLAIVAKQKLIIVCHNHTLKQHVTKRLVQAKVILEQLELIITPTNDCWARDHGPISVVNEQGQVTALNFTFNGWGEKYPATLDNQINNAIFNQLPINTYKTINMVLEGGGIEVDEQGNLLTTVNCLLNNNRNPTMNKAAIEHVLKREFGVHNILWLNTGALEGDDTDSHIDTLARFAPNTSIVFQGCQNQNDSHFATLQHMKQELINMRTTEGTPFQLFELPWPDAQHNANGERLPATYANFLIINGAVLMPSYGTRQDNSAQLVLKAAFPEHDIIPINCRPIIEQFGSLHCLTMQLPESFLPTSFLPINFHQ